MWRSETDFVDDFLASIGPTKKFVHIIREFRTGYGLADILMIEYSIDIVAQRMKDLQSSISKSFDTNCAYAMAYLSGGRWTTFDGLKSNLNIHNGSIKPILENLAERKMIVTTGNRLKALPKEKVLAIKSVIAIEAKLRNWKRGILQAQRHLWFTNNSNILLPAINNAQLNRVIGGCRRHHVGLTLFDEGKTILPVIEIEKRRPYNTHLVWLLNELLMEEVGNGGNEIQP